MPHTSRRKGIPKAARKATISWTFMKKSDFSKRLMDFEVNPSPLGFVAAKNKGEKFVAARVSW